MLKNVEETSDNIDGYYFEDDCGTLFSVCMDGITVDIGSDYEATSFCMYTKDIPRFIKVLQAAYDHKASA